MGVRVRPVRSTSSLSTIAWPGSSCKVAIRPSMASYASSVALAFCMVACCIYRPKRIIFFPNLSESDDSLWQPGSHNREERKQKTGHELNQNEGNDTFEDLHILHLKRRDTIGITQ